jgi:hypothetical protein
VTLSASQYAVIAVSIAFGVVAIARFEMLCINDLSRRSDPELRYLSRQGWMVLIALAIPVGEILHLYYGRPR